jgi:predicted fused transcriptional regulator/phosphomethylpyrimidine kinase
MGDSESQSAARLRRILAQPGTQILGYDEDAWSKCDSIGYRTLPIESALALFRASRATSLMVIENLSASVLDNFAIHSESGKYSLEDWIRIYTQHPIDHANQLLKAINYSG